MLPLPVRLRSGIALALLATLALQGLSCSDFQQDYVNWCVRTGKCADGGSDGSVGLDGGSSDAGAADSGNADAATSSDAGADSGVDAGPVAVQLAFISTALQVSAGQCSSDILIEQQDDAGQPVTAAAPVTVRLSSDAGVSLYAGSACPIPASINIVGTIAVGSSSTTFSFNSASPGIFGLTATSASLQGASQDQTVIPAGSPSFVFIPGNASLKAGTCLQQQVVSVSSDGGLSPAGAGGVTVKLSSPDTDLFSGACTDAGATSLFLTIPQGRSDAGFEVEACPPSTYSVSASASGYSSTSFDFTVFAGPPAQLEFASGPPTGLVTGVCSPPQTFDVEDVCRNPVSAGGTLSGSGVALSSAPAGVSYYQTPDCDAGALTSLPILQTDTQGTFYLQAFAPNSYQVGVCYPSCSVIGAAETVNIAQCGTVSSTCSGATCCTGLVCAGVPQNCCIALGTATACSKDTQCCTQAGLSPVCDAGACCLRSGSLGTSTECCDGATNAMGMCCGPDGRTCVSDAECCSGSCPAGTCAPDAGTCKSNMTGCNSHTQCCSDYCRGGMRPYFGPNFLGQCADNPDGGGNCVASGKPVVPLQCNPGPGNCCSGTCTLCDSGAGPCCQ